MRLLEERIQKDGIVKEGNVLKVDSFLNHQMDVKLFRQIAEEWKRLYDMAKKQSLVGVCFAGVQRLVDSEKEDYCGKPEMLYLTWMGMELV